jgi:hypothetical protein
MSDPNPNGNPSPLGFTIDGTAQQLSGQSPSGFTLLNSSTGGQTIWYGKQGVVAASTGANAGFPLVAGAAIDRARFQNLRQVYVIASGAGALLSAEPL